MAQIRYVFLVLAILILPFYYNYYKKQEPVKQEIVDIDISIYNGLSSVLYFIAKDFGYFESEGLKANLKLYSSGKQAVDTLLNDEVNYANGSEFVAVKNSFMHKNYSILASTSEASINGILVKKDSFTKPIEIKDKNIATSIGTASEYYTGIFLEHISLSMSDINIVNLKASQTKNFLEDKTIDGFFTWEPNIYNALKDNNQTLTYLPMPKGYEFYFCLLVNKNELKKNQNSSKALLKALIKAENWANNNPLKFRQYVMKKFSFSKEYFDYIISSYNITVSLSNSMFISMKDEAKWLKQNELIENKGSKNYLKIIDSTFLESIDKSLVTLVR